MIYFKFFFPLGSGVFGMSLTIGILGVCGLSLSKIFLASTELYHGMSKPNCRATFLKSSIS